MPTPESASPAESASRPTSNALRFATLAVSVLALVIYVAVFSRGGLRTVAFFFPFTMIPFGVTAGLAAKWRGFAAQLVLLATTLAYAAWFVYVYVDAMIINLDPQSPIAFLFVTVYALPVLAVLWLVAYAVEWQREAQSKSP